MARPGADLRMVAVAGAAWAGALAGSLLGAWSLLGVVALAAMAVAPRRRTTCLGLAAAFLTAVACVSLRTEAVSTGAVAHLAQGRASAHATLVVRSDPRLSHGRFGDRVTFRAQVRSLSARGVSHRIREPVLVLADPRWKSVRLGSTLRARGRLAASDSRDLAAMFSVRGPPQVVARPGVLLIGAENMRAGIRRAVAGQPEGPRALVPALVDGDDTGMSPDLVEDFRTTGLTHLAAVSGSNLAILVGFLLIIARGIGVQARGLVVVGVLGVAGFVLLARTEPSVIRAAVMGSVALLGMGLGRVVGTRSLGVAVTVLVLFDPWLSLAPGFVLSVCATAGILFFGPTWRDQLARWLPRWIAEAVAVPLAAQLACTPVVAAISGQVSLAAVGANLLVAPAVGPVTVCGLVGGLVATGWEALGQILAAPGAWGGRWIIWVATHGSALPVPAFDVGIQPWSLAVLTGACVLIALALGAVLGRRLPTLFCAVAMVLLVMVPLPTPGWPPKRWIAVMCDVGQGDGIVIRTGPGEALVVDAGPDPRSIDRCLTRLGIQRVSTLVLTHFHADHVDGIGGVLDGRRVDTILVTPFAEPASGVGRVREAARESGVPVLTATPGTTTRRGPVTWQVLAPTAPPPVDSESPPNDASVVLLVETRGVRMLLLGDEETGSQQQLERAWPGLRADVLKVAHHGSAKQDEQLIASLGARVALVSVGEDNDYGHPAPRLLSMLRRARLPLKRTDRDGDIALVERGGLRVQTSR